MPFSKLGLMPELLRAVADQGYDTPTPIQSQAIPAVLAYNLYGKWVAACEAELEGFAHDLREMALTVPSNKG